MFEEGRKLADFFRKKSEIKIQEPKKIDVGWTSRSETIKELLSVLKRATKDFSKFSDELQGAIAEVEEDIDRGVGEEEEIVKRLESALDQVAEEKAWDSEKRKTKPIK